MLWFNLFGIYSLTNAIDYFVLFYCVARGVVVYGGGVHERVTKCRA